MAEEIAEILVEAVKWLIILFFVILPFLALVFVTSFDINSTILKYFKLFVCIILPLLVILIGVIVGVNNFNVNILEITATWYYVIPITWFGYGIIFYSVLRE